MTTIRWGTGAGRQKRSYPAVSRFMDQDIVVVARLKESVMNLGLLLRIISAVESSARILESYVLMDWIVGFES